MCKLSTLVQKTKCSIDFTKFIVYIMPGGNLLFNLIYLYTSVTTDKYIALQQMMKSRLSRSEPLTINYSCYDCNKSLFTAMYHGDICHTCQFYFHILQAIYVEVMRHCYACQPSSGHYILRDDINITNCSINVSCTLSTNDQK